MRNCERETPRASVDMVDIARGVSRSQVKFKKNLRDDLYRVMQYAVHLVRPGFRTEMLGGCPG